MIWVGPILVVTATPGITRRTLISLPARACDLRMDTHPRRSAASSGNCQQFADGVEEQLLTRSRENVRLLIPTVVCVNAIATDIAHSAVTVSCHAHEMTGLHILGGQLILNEWLAGQVEDGDDNLLRMQARDYALRQNSDPILVRAIF